jgi:hypothetical protein
MKNFILCVLVGLIANVGVAGDVVHSAPQPFVPELATLKAEAETEAGNNQRSYIPYIQGLLAHPQHTLYDIAAWDKKFLLALILTMKDQLSNLSKPPEPSRLPSHYPVSEQMQRIRYLEAENSKLETQIKTYESINKHLQSQINEQDLYIKQLTDLKD